MVRVVRRIAVTAMKGWAVSCSRLTDETRRAVIRSFRLSESLETSLFETKRASSEIVLLAAISFQFFEETGSRDPRLRKLPLSLRVVKRGFEFSSLASHSENSSRAFVPLLDRSAENGVIRSNASSQLRNKSVSVIMERKKKTQRNPARRISSGNGVPRRAAPSPKLFSSISFVYAGRQGDSGWARREVILMSLQEWLRRAAHNRNCRSDARTVRSAKFRVRARIGFIAVCTRSRNRLNSTWLLRLRARRAADERASR